ncbi:MULTISPECIES: tRNA-dependent cyclodipeptide synthase [Actinoalloteichus]|uniref:Cyclodipeptide synthase n=1 Tax=Actinoalloteichus fjordicus TaxID=1612552 RepID=A0AAC9LDR7_9PSEU|nr:MULTISPECIES: tRNA-dependent cyclodipeptide synthase [Actinoalloteichus]APU15476.1 hypothetical protein UA74_17230 [Actinoalloteichus fjordicus]APU21543.1 hypothetical protein UA75_17765 [Actinoalloteichus sp. GBA129-24]
MPQDTLFLTSPFNPIVITADGCANGRNIFWSASVRGSYLSVALLTRLLGWAHRRFAEVDVVIPDTTLVHTQLELGHSEKETQERSREECNRVVRAWDQIGLERAPERWHLLSEFAECPRYRALLSQAEAAVAQPSPLRRACLHTSRVVLESRRPSVPFTDEQIEQGARYVVAELPFVVDTAGILGVPSSVSFYHRAAEFIREVVAARGPLRPVPSPGCALIRPATTAAESSASAATTLPG